MKKISVVSLLILAMLLTVSCDSAGDPLDKNPVDSAETGPAYTNEDLRADLGIHITFPPLIEEETEKLGEDKPPLETEPVGNPDSGEDENVFLNPHSISQSYNTYGEYKMKVFRQLEIYSSMEDKHPQTVLDDGTSIVVQEIEGNSGWLKVSFEVAPFTGYAKAGFINAVAENLELYGELPIETGMARTNENTYVPAYSHLVDVRKYFKVFSSTNELAGLTDYSQYDLVVSMKLSTRETTIGEPFYDTNLCMVQYDLIPMIQKAVELFAKDGYRIVIYDAYRPTSVQQRWFDVVRVHKWVADPSIGMGGIHDRGTALDISLIDMNGNLLEMPTPMHTFTEESSRLSPTMTQKARDNMNYMLNVMLQCGFTYINSEWWHFQDVNTKYYLPTDHPIDLIPLVPSEITEKVTE